MGIEHLTVAIPVGARLLLDSSVLITYFSGNEPVSPLAAAIVDSFVRTGRNDAIVSAVSVMETLVRPLRAATRVDRAIVDFLKNFPHVQVAPVDFDVALEAAAIRAIHGLRAPDALIVATALGAGARYVVTNDGAWAQKLSSMSARIGVFTIGDYL